MPLYLPLVCFLGLYLLSTESHTTDCCVFCVQRWSCCLHRVDRLWGLLCLKIELASSPNELTVESSVLEDRAIVYTEWTGCVIFCAWRQIYCLHRGNRLRSLLCLKTEGASGLYKLNTLYEVNIQKALSLPDYFIIPNLIRIYHKDEIPRDLINVLWKINMKNARNMGLRAKSCDGTTHRIGHCSKPASHLYCTIRHVSVCLYSCFLDKRLESICQSRK